MFLPPLRCSLAHLAPSVEYLSACTLARRRAEVIECLRRLLLACVIGIASPDSAVSPVFGLLLCMGFSHIFEQRPFKDADDSTLAIVLTYSLMLFFLAALMIKSDVSSDATDDQVLFGVFLVVVLSGGPISIFVQVLFAVLKETGYLARRSARIEKRKVARKAKMMAARKQKALEKARKEAIARGEDPDAPVLKVVARPECEVFMEEIGLADAWPLLAKVTKVTKVEDIVRQDFIGNLKLMSEVKMSTQQIALFRQCCRERREKLAKERTASLYKKRKVKSFREVGRLVMLTNRMKDGGGPAKDEKKKDGAQRDRPAGKKRSSATVGVPFGGDGGGKGGVAGGLLARLKEAEAKEGALLTVSRLPTTQPRASGEVASLYPTVHPGGGGLAEGSGEGLGGGGFLAKLKATKAAEEAAAAKELGAVGGRVPKEEVVGPASGTSAAKEDTKEEPRQALPGPAPSPLPPPLPPSQTLSPNAGGLLKRLKEAKARKEQQKVADRIKMITGMFKQMQLKYWNSLVYGLRSLNMK